MRRLFIAFALGGFAAGLAATLLWFSRGDVAAVITTPRSAAMLALLIALTSANLAIRWFRWHFLVRRFIKTIPTRRSLQLYFGTLLGIATPLYVGECVRSALAARGNPGARRMVAWVWFAERLSDAAALGVFILLARRYWVALLLLCAAGALAGSWLRSHPAGHILLRPREVAVLLASSLAAWTLPVIGLWIVVAGLGGPIRLAQAAEVFSAGTLLGGLSLVPLGSGVAGSSMIVQLVSLGVSEGVGTGSIALLRAGTSGYALVLGALALVTWRRQIFASSPLVAPQEHFAAIASDYEQQIPVHVRNRLVGRKTRLMARWLEDEGYDQGAHGLDIGCGPGWYAVEMAERGHAVWAIDRSAPLLAHARRNTAGHAVRLGVAEAQALPYADASFDFVYAVNTLHHITHAEAREATLREIVRVLKPGGLFFLQEINVQNPLFALYMGYLFPLLYDIDDGTEVWLRPSCLPVVEGGRWLDRKLYMTFLPDFLPYMIYSRLLKVEAALERSRLRTWSAHFVACLSKEVTPGGGTGC